MNDVTIDVCQSSYLSLNSCDVQNVIIPLDWSLLSIKNKF